MKLVGQIAGPTKRDGQKTFCVVAQIFNKAGAVATHTKANGKEVPIVFLSHPIDADEQGGVHRL